MDEIQRHIIAETSGFGEVWSAITDLPELDNHIAD
jgi:hypothetical protein